MKKNIIALFLLVSVIVCAHPSAAKTSMPGRTKSFVNDYAGIIDAETKATLEKELADLKHKKGVEFIVSTFSSLKGANINEFVPAYTHKWRRPFLVENDNRIHIMVFLEEHKARMGVGFGINNIVTPDITRSILSDTMIPEFSRGDYSAGTKKGVDAIMKVLDESKIHINNLPFNLKNVIVILILAIMLFLYVASYIKKLK